MKTSELLQIEQRWSQDFENAPPDILHQWSLEKARSLALATQVDIELCYLEKADLSYEKALNEYGIFLDNDSWNHNDDFPNDELLESLEDLSPEEFDIVLSLVEEGYSGADSIETVKFLRLETVKN